MRIFWKVIDSLEKGVERNKHYLVINGDLSNMELRCLEFSIYLDLPIDQRSDCCKLESPWNIFLFFAFTSSIFSYGNPSRLGVPDELEATLFFQKNLRLVSWVRCSHWRSVCGNWSDWFSGQGCRFWQNSSSYWSGQWWRFDGHTVYVEIDNLRMISVGDKLYVSIYKVGRREEVWGMLSVLEDKDGDGKADGPPKHLVKEISTRKYNQARGVDHTTNGIRMGIDGWIYVAVGDFGFVDATGTDGTKLTMYGGGIIRKAWRHGTGDFCPWT